MMTPTLPGSTGTRPHQALH